MHYISASAVYTLDDALGTKSSPTVATNSVGTQTASVLSLLHYRTQHIHTDQVGVSYAVGPRNTVAAAAIPCPCSSMKREVCEVREVRHVSCGSSSRFETSQLALHFIKRRSITSVFAAP
jgi:hypothetical protein